MGHALCHQLPQHHVQQSAVEMRTVRSGIFTSKLYKMTLNNVRLDLFVKMEVVNVMQSVALMMTVRYLHQCHEMSLM